MKDESKAGKTMITQAEIETELKQEILKTMAELISRPQTDTIWITDTETVFDRLAGMYLLAGGSIQELTEKFPEYI